eukprot:g2038.t1
MGVCRSYPGMNGTKPARRRTRSARGLIMSDENENDHVPSSTTTEHDASKIPSPTTTTASPPTESAPLPVSVDTTENAASMASSPGRMDSTYFSFASLQGGMSSLTPRAKKTENILATPEWQPNASSSHCTLCEKTFSLMHRRHHCRKCGCLICSACSRRRIIVMEVNGGKRPVRVCDNCYRIKRELEMNENKVGLRQSVALLKQQQRQSDIASALASKVAASGAVEDRGEMRKKISPILKQKSKGDRENARKKFVTVRVPIPKNAFAGQTVRVKYKNRVYATKVPADAAARGHGTFPARIPVILGGNSPPGNTVETLSVTDPKGSSSIRSVRSIANSSTSSFASTASSECRTPRTFSDANVDEVIRELEAARARIRQLERLLLGRFAKPLLELARDAKRRIAAPITTMMMLSKRICVSSLLLLLLSAAKAQPKVTTQKHDFSPLRELLEGWEFTSNFSVAVGNAREGNLFTFNGGDFTMHTQIPTGSTSKWPSAMMFAALADEGTISGLDALVSDYLPWWTTDPKDLRSTVTFRMLLSFTSGFGGGHPGMEMNTRAAREWREANGEERRRAGGLSLLLDGADACDQEKGDVTECAKGIYETVKLIGTPGQVYSYNSNHLQIAAAVAVAASNMTINEVIDHYLLKPYNMTESYYAGKCPDFGASLVTTGSDYERFLQGLLGYKTLSKATIDASEEDSTPFLKDYYTLYGDYGFGHFLLCFDSYDGFTKECEDAHCHMDPGAFGFIPIIDRKNEYYVEVVAAEIAPTGSYPLSGIPEYLAVAIKPHVDAILSDDPPPKDAHLHYTPSLFSLGLADVNYCVDCKLHPENCEYWTSGLAFLWVDLTDSPGWMVRRRIQKKERNRRRKELVEKLPKLFRNLLTNQIVVFVPMAFATNYFGALRISPELPSLYEVVTHIAFFVLLEEIMFYGTHRLLHTNWLYKNVHKVHHQFTQPTALAAVYAHPAEVLLGNVLPLWLSPCIIMRSHIVTWYVWIVVAILGTQYHHCGYRLSPPWDHNPDFHDKHHEAFNGNYGLLYVSDWALETRTADIKKRLAAKRKGKHAYYANIRTRITLEDLSADALTRQKTIDEYLEEFRAIRAVSILCMVWELSSMFLIFSTFSNLTNPISIVLHALGAFVTLWYCVDGWSSEHFLGIFFIFSFVPAIIDAAAFVFYSCIHKGTRVHLSLRNVLRSCCCCCYGGRDEEEDAARRNAAKDVVDESTGLLDEDEDDDDDEYSDVDDDDDEKEDEDDGSGDDEKKDEDDLEDTKKSGTSDSGASKANDDDDDSAGHSDAPSMSDVSDVGPLTDDDGDEEEEGTKRPRRRRRKRREAI